jgi:hypothetical protein
MKKLEELRETVEIIGTVVITGILSLQPICLGVVALMFIVSDTIGDPPCMG